MEEEVMTESSPPAGWYPDPSGTPDPRYFDGADWTESRAAPLANRIISDDERVEILNQALATAVARGGRVESHTRFQAVIVYGQPVNHVLHAILTVFTCFLWGIVWAVIAGTGGERREVLQADPQGGVITNGRIRSK
jgi:Protein of unknown function (DUF2510)